MADPTLAHLPDESRWIVTLLEAVPLKLTFVPEREALIVSFTVVFGTVVPVATVVAVVDEVDATDELVVEDEGATVLDVLELLELEELLDEEELLDDEGGVAPVTTTFAYMPSDACVEIVQ